MISHERMEQCHRLWDELADFPASRVDDALNHLMSTLREWIGARNVVWVGAARLKRGLQARADLQHGWRCVAFRYLVSSPDGHRLSAQVIEEQDSAPSMTTCALAATTGKLRVHRLRDGFVDFAAFKRTAHYRVMLEGRGISDRMFIGVPVSADVESFLVLDRDAAAGRFSVRDTEWAAYAMRGLKWFHRELMLSRGLLVASAPLSAMERRVLSLLLTERREAEIAARLGHSPHTTHGYVKDVLRKFGVRGRTGLMAMWLARGG